MVYSMGSTPALVMVTTVCPDAPKMTPPALPSSDTVGLGSMLGSACLTRALKGRLRGPVSASRGMDADRGSSACNATMKSCSSETLQGTKLELEPGRGC